MRRKMEKVVPEMVTTHMVLVDMITSLLPEVVKEWTEMAEKWEANARAPNPFETIHKDQHVASMRAELAVEAAAVEDMHITELIAMGLQLEQHSQEDTDAIRGDMHITELIVMGLQLEQHSECWAPHKLFPGLANIRAHEDKVCMHTAEAQPIPGVMVSSIKLWLLSDVARAPAADATKVAVKDTVFLHKYQLQVGIMAEALHDDSKVAKKMKGGVPDLLTPEACSGMAKKHTQGDADTEHRSNKRCSGETQTQEGPLSQFPLLGTRHPTTPPRGGNILADINKQMDVKVEKEHREELKEKESSKMNVDE
ncbi:hypothetical protein B0H14DRAFT_3430161 [Mycena olivaceomarginata]|nr:hypothetical protein B0H14DRAFT_3430161 [Mycena olivaceomarginata]